MLAKQIIYILTICSIWLLTSCSDIIERTYWSDGNYVVWDDAANPSCKTLNYDINGSGHGRVECVTQIGSNERFIVVESIDDLKYNKKEYWILDKKKDNPLLNSNEIMEGPFTQAQFNKRKRELGISNIEFEKEIK